MTQRMIVTIPGRYIPENAKHESYADVKLDFYTYEKNGSTVCLCYKGRAKKPYFHYRYKTPELAQAKLEETVASYKSYNKEKSIQDYKEKRELVEFIATVKVGDVYYASWGYDQTNVNFFQIVEKSKSNVQVIEINSERVSDVSFDSTTVIAVPNSFKNEVVMKRRITKRKSIKINDCYSAHKWDGKPKRESWGH